MPALASLADIEAVLGRPTTLRLLDDNADGVADTAVVDDVIRRASNEVKRYLGGSFREEEFSVEVPPDVRDLATEIAIQNAYLRANLLNERGETPWSGRYKSAVEQLKAINKGDLRIDRDGAHATPAHMGGGARAVIVIDGEGAPPFARHGTGFF